MPPAFNQSKVADAAVNLNFRADNECRFIGGEKHRSFGKLNGLAHPSNWHELAYIRTQGFFFIGSKSQLAKSRRFSRAGAQTIYTNAAIDKLAGKCPCERKNPRLAGSIDTALR